ncbi:efflux RND transporter permease subunit [Campylobacter majalis]|uniref:efflux RND transporter permease subunit n=1 Tax=Campylobacter majalis TaxID=2790656 RepID=UPI003D69E641
MKRLFKFIVNFPKIVLSFVLVSSLFFAYYATKLEIDASSETLLLQNDPDLAVWQDVASRYVSPNFLVVTYTPNSDLLSPDSLKMIQKISDELSKNDMIENVISILNIPLLQSVKGGLSGILNHTPTLKDDDLDLEVVKNELKTSPIYSNNLVSSDLKTTAIVLNLKSDKKYEALLNERNLLSQKEVNKTLSADEITKFASVKTEFKNYRDELRKKEHENLQKIKNTIKKYNSEQNALFLGGATMIADDMVSFVKNDLSTYGFSVAVLLAISLWLFFRQIRWVALAIGICVLSLVFSMGIFGLFNWEITVISSNFVSLVLIISISVAIHLIVSYREFYIKYQRYSQKQLVYLTLKDKANPSFWAIFTTIIGFTSLMSADIKPVIMLGIMMSSGIAVSLILAFLIFGSVVTLLPKLAPKNSFENSFSFTKFCAKFAIKDRWLIYGACAFLIAFGIYGISQLKVENSFIGYFKKDTDIRSGMEVIDNELGGTIPLDVIVKFNEVQDKVLTQEMDEFESEFQNEADSKKYFFNSYRTRIALKVHDYLKEQNFIGNVSSLATLIKVIKELNNGEIDDFLLSAMYEKLPNEYKNIILSPYVSIDDNELRFSIRVVDSDERLRRDEFIKKLQNDLNELLKNENASASVSGMLVLYNNVLQNLVASQISSFSISIAVLFVLFCIVFKSIKIALIAIITNIIPLCVLFGIMGLFGIALDVMSVTIAAISIGIGVDDIIHYLHRYKHERHTHDINTSIKNSHASIGYAMYYTSFAVILGFSVMVSSNFIPTIYFGLLTLLVMALMLSSALIVLPRVIKTLGV